MQQLDSKWRRLAHQIHRINENLVHTVEYLATSSMSLLGVIEKDFLFLIFQ